MFGRNQQAIMDFSTAGQLDAASEESAIGARVNRLLDCLLVRVPVLQRCGVCAIDADPDMCPADDIGVQWNAFDDLAILD